MEATLSIVGKREDYQRDRMRLLVVEVEMGSRSETGIQGARKSAVPTRELSGAPRHPNELATRENRAASVKNCHVDTRPLQRLVGRLPWECVARTGGTRNRSARA